MVTGLEGNNPVGKIPNSPRIYTGVMQIYTAVGGTTIYITSLFL